MILSLTFLLLLMDLKLTDLIITKKRTDWTISTFILILIQISRTSIINTSSQESSRNHHLLMANSTTQKETSIPKSTTISTWEFRMKITLIERRAASISLINKGDLSTQRKTSPSYSITTINIREEEDSTSFKTYHLIGIENIIPIDFTHPDWLNWNWKLEHPNILPLIILIHNKTLKKFINMIIKSISLNFIIWLSFIFLRYLFLFFLFFTYFLALFYLIFIIFYFIFLLLLIILLLINIVINLH